MEIKPMRLTFCGATGLYLIIFIASMSAQVLTGRVIGDVRDGSGALMPGVTLILTSPGRLRAPMTVVTDEKGAYRFLEVPPGTYDLKAELQGFNAHDETGLIVAANATVERNITLQLGQLQESVTVSGDSPVVDTKQTAVAIGLSNEKVESIPTSHYSIQQLAELLPGNSPSSPGSDYGGQSQYIMGSQPNETAWLIDGVTTNDPRSGGIWNAGDMDAIQEVQVTAVGASAEYQIAQGGVFSVVQKSGTNNFAGNAQGMWRPDGLVSKPIKINCACPAGTSGYTSRAYIDNSAHIGGPIVRDRAWFFGGVQFKGLTSLNPGIDPESPLLYSPYDHDYRSMVKVSANISPKIRVSSMFENEHWFEPAFPDLANPVSTISGYGGSIPTYAEELLITLSSRTLFSVRASGRIQPNDYGTPVSGDLTTPWHYDTITGVASGGSPELDRQEVGRHSISAKIASFFRTGAVEHDFRLGVQTERASEYNAGAYPSGVQYYDAGGKSDQALFQPSFVYGASSNSIGLWVDDQLTAGRVTFQAGVRYDRMSANSPDFPAVNNALDKVGTVHGLGNMFTWNVWSPRGGVTIKITQDGRTVLRGSAGRYYSPLFLNTISGVHPGQTPSTLTQFNPATGKYDTVLSITDPLANIAVDRNMKDQYTDQYSIGVDRQIARDTGLTISYVRKNAQQEMGWTDVGGLYSSVARVLPDSRVLTALALVNSPADRRFLLTNGPGFFSRYNGLLISVNKRYSSRWLATVSYAFSKTEGLLPPTLGSRLGSFGLDPNDYVNHTGRLSPADRPHIFGVQASYQIPRVEVTVSPNLQWQSGIPYAGQASVTLPQGRRSIDVDPPGTYRTPTQYLLAMRISKDLWRQNARHVQVIGDVRNLLQDERNQSVLTKNLYSPNFGLPASWLPPRMAVIGLRLDF